MPWCSGSKARCSELARVANMGCPKTSHCFEGYNTTLNYRCSAPCSWTTCQLSSSTALSKYSCKCWRSCPCIPVFLSPCIHQHIETTKSLLLYKSHNPSISLRCEPQQTHISTCIYMPGRVTACIQPVTQVCCLRCAAPRCQDTNFR